MPSLGVRHVYLARHGQTEWNRAGRRQGQLDSPLTGEGLAQARQLAAFVAGLQVDALFSSPLGRAVTTATVCAEELGLPIVIIEELGEVHHGEMAGLTRVEIESNYPGQLEQRTSNHYEWRFPGGESYADADRRAAVALERIDDHGSSSPLIVSHEMIGRMLLRNLLNADAQLALTWKQPHDVLYRVDLPVASFTRISTESTSE